MSARSQLEQNRNALLEVRDLEVDYTGRGARRQILTGVNLAVGLGETVGIVGESGSGKSILAKSLLRLLPAGVQVQRGLIRYRNVDLGALNERQMREYRGARLALMFQDPFTMLNPLLRCGTHVTEGLRTGSGKLSGEAAWAEAARRLAELGINDPDVVYRYPFQLSGGMRQRVALAAALARDPELLIADEPSTALDVTTQSEILKLIQTIQRTRQMSVVLITHDLRVAFSICDRVYVLYAGAVLEVGASSEMNADPLHPYTLGLLQSEPPVDHRLSVLRVIKGNVPSPDDVAGKCRFSPRCRWADDECLAAEPSLVEHGGRLSACRRLEEIHPDLRLERALLVERAAVTATQPESVVASIRELTKIFPGRRGRSVLAVDGVSIVVGQGESVGLVGESGSGKTTIARCLVGLERPSGGEIEIGGLTVFGPSRRTLDPKVRRVVQMIFQDPYSSLDPRQTVGSALAEGLRLFGVRGGGVEARSSELLSKVGLPADYARRLPATLSGGERQRVAIARALTSNPRLLVCDEPLSALDVSVQAQVLNLFRQLRVELGLSYLFITHDLAVVRQIVERVYVLYKGRVVEEGPVDEVLDSPRHEYTQQLIASIPGRVAADPTPPEGRRLR